MIQDNTKDYVYNAIFSEMQKAVELHGFFKNHHEFYGVLKEEYEEATENEKYLNEKMELLWNAVKTDNLYDLEYYCYSLLGTAFHNVLEWIQVCSVIKKYLGGGKYD